jgi:hypothetical protein
MYACARVLFFSHVQLLTCYFHFLTPVKLLVPTGESNYTSKNYCITGERPAAMQRGKNAASPIPGRWWSHLSAGLGLSACLPPRTAAIAVLLLGLAGHVVVWTGT